MDPEAYKILKPFTFHGVEFSEVTSTGQAIGRCPFTDREGKFYVNMKSLLWDSKTAGLSGNLGQFLYQISEQNKKDLEKNLNAQKRIAVDRGIPRIAFLRAGIGFNGKAYTIPVSGGNGAKDSLTDLRIWSPRKKILSTPKAKVGLFGVEGLLDPLRKEEPVYICEGEHDAIALRWLLWKLEEEGIVVGVPGADTFKQEWAHAFNERDVVALYDSDEAGDRGELKCHQTLKGIAASLQYVRWPSDVPNGFDVRDWIKYGAIKLQTPRACWRRLQVLFTGNTLPRKIAKVDLKEDEGGGGGEKREKKVLKTIDHSELFLRYKKWLHIKEESPLAVIFGTCLANRLEGDPIWLFVVAPPGGMKSELIMTLSGSSLVESVSTLTPHALVSGANMMGGGDPSLIPKLDGKILAIKDFTTILNAHPNVRDDIFGQLRDCYDGKFEKMFGNGIFRKYESRFGIIAGVTPSIDAIASLHQGLGERFLKYRMESNNLIHIDEVERIRRAVENVYKESGMREDLSGAAAQFLARQIPKTDRLPKPGKGMTEKTIKLAMLVSRLRGVVNRDKYNSSMLLSKSSFEVGTRLAKQFMKLAIGIALYYGSPILGDREYMLAAKVAMGSVPDKVEEIVKTLYVHAPPQGMLSKDLLGKCRSMTLSTIYRCLQDMSMVGVVEQIGVEAKNLWRVSATVKSLIKEAQVWQK